jgi:hypothetical protein
MNDLDAVAEFRADVAPPTQEALHRARTRMLTATTVGPARGSRKFSWGWRLTPVAALAVAAAVAVASATWQGAGPAGQTAPIEAASPPKAPTEARTVLRLAAVQAGAEPTLEAQPSQFVYIESQELQMIVNLDVHEIPLPIPEKRKDWLSVDGSRNGLVQVEPDVLHINGSLAPSEPAYKRDLPTTTAAMRTYLYSKTEGDQPRDERAWTMVGDLLIDSYVPPASMAALFEAAATIPDVSVVPDTVDAAGRHGIAVSRTGGRTRHDIIFDRTSYKYLGTRDQLVKDWVNLPAGTVTGGTAILKVAVVDEAGQPG